MTEFFSRVTSAVTAATQAWRANNAPTYVNTEWDTWDARLKRYELNDLYYHNLQYDKLNKWIDHLRVSGALYTNTHSVYNPVARLVNIYADKIYPAMLDLEHMTGGAVPVVGDDRLRKAIIRLFRWSNWNMEKQNYTRTGAKYGDSFIQIIDDINSKRVILEVVPPQKVRYMRKDDAGNIKEIWFLYKEAIDDRPNIPGVTENYDNRTRDVLKQITGDTIAIYHDNKLFDSYDNPFGFVPVVHVKGNDEGYQYGVTPWHTARPKIDGINSQASVLNDEARVALNPYIVTTGAKLVKGSLNRSASRMDEVINIPVPSGEDAKVLTLNIDIASALNNIKSQLDELREDLPELFLFKLTDMTVAPSGIALRQYFDLAVGRIQGAQGIYDDPLIRAIQMACTVGGVQRYTDFEGFDLNSFDRGDLDFTIRPREVINDVLSRDSRIKYFLASGAPQSAIWTEMNVGEDDQAEWKKELEVQNEEAIQASIDRQNNQGGEMNTQNINTDNNNTGSGV